MFHVALHEPEIPNNTGNIGRTCVTTGCALHLIEPIGFDLSERACRRAGLDYWPRLDLTRHADVASYERSVGTGRLWLFSRRRGQPYFQASLRPGDHFLFGKETAGLPASIMDAHADRVLRLPMLPDERSLNVAIVVCAVIYEGIRQCVARGDVSLDSDGMLPSTATLRSL